MERKRKRPTVAQVRELEEKVSKLEKYIKENTNEELKKKLDDQIEGTSALIKDCDGWRELYRKACSQADLEKHSRELSDVLVIKLKERNTQLKEQNQLLKEKVDALKARGLWARIINK